MAFSFRDYRASSRASAPARPSYSQQYDSAESVGPFRDPYASADYGQKRKRKTTKRNKMATKRRRRRRNGRKAAARGLRRLIPKVGRKRRRRRSVAAMPGRRRGGRRRSANRITRIVRRRGRRGGRRGSGGAMGLKTIQKDIFAGIINGAWVVAGDVSGNLAKIFSNQTGALGNVAQLAGGFVAAMFVGKVWPRQREATRFVMAGAASGVIRQIASDVVSKMDGTSAIKTHLTAALQGYPHSDYLALEGYSNVMDGAGYVGMPGYNGQ